MTALTTIDYGDGVSVSLEHDGVDRSMREGAAATNRRHGCPDCGHHTNAHKGGNCTTLMIPADKSWNIVNAKKCGCAAMSAKKGRAA